MTGSILQLAAIGIDTIYLTGNPTITHFKVVYRRHTNFTIYPIVEKVQNFTKFNSACRYKLPKKGDCINNVYLQFELGDFNVIYDSPTKKNITNILNNFGVYTWINSYEDDFIITPNIYKTNIKPYIYDAVENYVLLNNFYIRFINDIERGINFYHDNNNVIINNILKKINIIYAKNSFYDDRDYVYLLLDKLKKFLLEQNYIDNFEYAYNTLDVDLSGQPLYDNINNVINTAFTKTSLFQTNDNIIFQGDYIDWLFNFGYGLYSLDSTGDYIRDNSGNRVEKAYKLDNSGNYIYDNSGNKQGILSNLTPNTKTLSRMFDILLCYKRDLDGLSLDMNSIQFVSPEYIRNRMYDLYLNDIFLNSIFINIGVFFPTSNFFNTQYIFRLLIILFETAIKTPNVINYLDKKISEYYENYLNDIYGNSSYEYLYYHYTDASGTYYKDFDSYKLIFRFLNILDSQIIYNEKTIDDIRPYLLKSIKDNLITNYILFDIIVLILGKFQFVNNYSIDISGEITVLPKNKHFRYGTYTTYTKYIDTYIYDQEITTDISPMTFEQSDGLIDLIQNDGDFKSNIYSECFFQTDVLNYCNNYFNTLNNNLPNTIFNPFINDKTLWDFLIINQDPFKSFLQDISFNNIPVYNILATDLSNNALNKLAIMNFLPLYLLYEIPLAVNYILTQPIKDIMYYPTQLDYITITPGTLTILDLSSNSYIDGSFSKISLYTTILQNTILDIHYVSSTEVKYVIDADFINKFADNYLIDSNKFSLFRLLRPEKKYAFYDTSGTLYFIPNIRAVIEEYRKKYYDLIFNVTSEPLNVKRTLFVIIDMLLNSYMAYDNTNLNDTDIPVSILQINQTITPLNYLTYNYYKYNDYRFLPLEYIINNEYYSNNFGIINYLPENNVTQFKYAQSSIYNYIEKYNFNLLNKIFNDLLLEANYYINTLGLGMYNIYNVLFERIKNNNVSSNYPTYFTGSYVTEFNNNNIYPEIDISYNYGSIGTGSTGINYYSIYNNTGHNINTPTNNGYDYNDFQLLYLDASFNINFNNDIYLYFNDPNGNNIFRTVAKQLENELYSAYISYHKFFDIQKYIKYDVSFNTVSDIIDYFNSFINTGGDAFMISEIDIVKIILNGDPNIGTYNYLSVGNMLYTDYDISLNNILNWSFKDLFELFTISPNPFDISTTPLLYECYELYNVYGNDIYDKYIAITNNVVNEYIYNNKYKDTPLYYDFQNKYKLFVFLKKHIIYNTDGISDAKYLLRFEDPTITIYEINILDYLKINKLTYYDIILKILNPKKDISGFSPNTAIDYTNQRYIPYFSIQSIFATNNTFEGSELDIILKSMVNNLPANYCWVRELGHYICDYINLEINGDVIDSYNPQLYTLGRKLYGEATKLRGYDYLIGNRKELYTYDNINKSNIKITIPLRFWFCKDAFNSLPMTNILYSNVEILFKVKKLMDLLIIAPYSYLDKTPRFRCNVIINNIYLEVEERLRIAASKLEFLVETHHTSGVVLFTSKDIVNKMIKTNLYFSGPAKILLWRAKIRINNINTKWKTNDKYNWNQNGLIELTRKIQTVYDPNFKYSVNLVYTYEVPIKIIEWTKILFNGNVRQQNNSDYFNYVVPYGSNLSYLDESEFVYSFALFPKLLQPSGAANLSMIEEVLVEHTLTDEIINIMQENDFVLEMEYFTQTYQIMRVMSGFIAPAFIYPK